jgi:hypothetical protein
MNHPPPPRKRGPRRSAANSFLQSAVETLPGLSYFAGRYRIMQRIERKLDFLMESTHVYLAMDDTVHYTPEGIPYRVPLGASSTMRQQAVRAARERMHVPATEVLVEHQASSVASRLERALRSEVARFISSRTVIRSAPSSPAPSRPSTPSPEAQPAPAATSASSSRSPAPGLASTVSPALVSDLHDAVTRSNQVIQSEADATHASRLAAHPVLGRLLSADTLAKVLPYFATMKLTGQLATQVVRMVHLVNHMNPNQVALLLALEAFHLATGFRLPEDVQTQLLGDNVVQGFRVLGFGWSQTATTASYFCPLGSVTVARQSEVSTAVLPPLRSVFSRAQSTAREALEHVSIL